MLNYRLLALDLDETLLTKDKKITKASKHWIDRAKKAGIIVIFATGRGLQRVLDFRNELELNTPMVLVNGAEVWGYADELLKRSFISRNDIYKLQQLAVEENASYWGYNVDALVGHRNWTEEMFHKDWLKFGIRHQDLHVMERIRKQASRLPSIEITQSAPVNIEIAAKGISKETGVRKVCEHLGIEMEEVMAIGDNLNDYKLMQAAGFGVAMGNGDQRLKDIADVVTDTNEQDGVAKAIERHLFG